LRRDRLDGRRLSVLFGFAGIGEGVQLALDLVEAAREVGLVEIQALQGARVAGHFDEGERGVDIVWEFAIERRPDGFCASFHSDLEDGGFHASDAL
jgi:hypothetical protein